MGEVGQRRAHLSIVFAALAVSRLVEDRTGWTIKTFVRTACRYRTIQIQAGNQTLTAEEPLPPDLRDALALRPIRGQPGDRAGHRRVRRHRPEHPRLGPQQPDVGQAVPTDRERDRQTTDDLPRVVPGQRPTPRLQP